METETVFANVASDNEVIYLTTHTRDGRRMVKKLTWGEAIRLGSNLLREGTRLMPDQQSLRGSDDNGMELTK